MNEKYHNGYLDFLKFLFALGIMGVHTYLIGFDFRLVYCGHLGVDFFFMVSGYFTAKKATEARDNKTSDAIPKYFINRIKNFYPFFLGACIYSFVITEIVNNRTINSIAGDLYNNIFDFLPLQVEGFPSLCVTSVQWFVSALFVVSPIAYSLVFKFGKNFSLCYAPIISIFLFGILQLEVGELSSVATFVYNIFFAGLFRAFGDMFLGTTLYDASKVLCKYKLTAQGNVVIRCMQIIILCCSIRLCFTNFSGYGDFVFVAVIFLYLLLLFSFPINNKFFQSKVFIEFGKISIVVFMIHVRTGQLINFLLPTLGTAQKLLLYYILSILVAYFLFYIVSFWKSRMSLRCLLIQHKNESTSSIAGKEQI